MEQHTRLQNYINQIEDSMERYVPNIPIPQAKLLDAMHYSLFAGGKRIRPVLLLEFCRMLGGSVEDAMPFACAMEMIHTYSLIHDDLPCMDDDEMRRGRPTNHIIFGEATAVLAGSSLLSAAFETMLDADNVKNIPPDRVISAAHTIAWASGVYGMAGGQQLDMDNEGMESTATSVALIHSLKTGALIGAAVEAGCILAGATQEQKNYAASFAHCLGMMFQIQDDILNIEGSAEQLGKSVGSDVMNDKLTFVKLLGMDECHRLVRKMTGEAIEFLQYFDDIDFLKWITGNLSHRSM